MDLGRWWVASTDTSGLVSASLDLRPLFVEPLEPLEHIPVSWWFPHSSWLLTFALRPNRRGEGVRLGISALGMDRRDFRPLPSIGIVVSAYSTNLASHTLDSREDWNTSPLNRIFAGFTISIKSPGWELIDWSIKYHTLHQNHQSPRWVDAPSYWITMEHIVF